MNGSEDRFDVVIVGGAVVGSAAAYFLSEDPGWHGSIAVVEPDPTYAQSSTALSAASVRHQFSNPVNIAISQFGTEFIADFPARVAVDGDAPELGFRDTGYLFLATESGIDVLRRNHEVQRAAGVEVVLLSPDETRQRFPYLSTTGLAGASLGLSGEGSLDANGLLQGLRRRARDNGVTYVRDRVVGFSQLGAGRIDHVILGSGRRLACGFVVNCAGAAAAQVAALAGVALPVEPRKRCVFVFDAAETIEAPFPLIIDPSGVWVRADPPYFMAGVAPPVDPAVSLADFTVDRRLFEERIWPVLAHRIPAFEALLVKHAWAGHYAYNTLDQNAVVGRADRVANLILANGFSGHGLQQAPGVGRAVSELIIHGEYRTLDLSELGHDRVAAERPFRELNVI